MSRRRASAGFTLVETLVAVTLLALLFGALMPVFQQGLSVLRISDRHARAVLLAQSVLQREAASVAPATEVWHDRAGSHGDLAWEVTREPYAAEDAGPVIDGSSTLALVKVTVNVTWPENETGISLSTLGLERAR